MYDIPESDWKTFRKLRELALDRFCAGVLREAAGLAAGPQPSNYDAYMRLYRLLDERDDELGGMFNDPRRSTAILQLSCMCRAGLITEEELATFGDDTRQKVTQLRDL